MVDLPDVLLLEAIGIWICLIIWNQIILVRCLMRKELVEVEVRAQAIHPAVLRLPCCCSLVRGFLPGLAWAFLPELEG